MVDALLDETSRAKSTVAALLAAHDTGCCRLSSLVRVDSRVPQQDAIR